MLHLQPTKRYAVISRSESDATVPRLPLEDAATTKALHLLKRHGYFVATHLGEALEADVQTIETELRIGIDQPKSKPTNPTKNHQTHIEK